jgi:DNA-binding NarL/FixJ family response regulator
MSDVFPALRVIVADDHPVFRDGLAMILRERGVDVVAEAADGQAALDATAEHQPDVVLMDLVMPGLGGIEATRRLVAGYPAVAVLVLTMSEDDDSLFAALRAGARGYLLKESAADDIVRAVVTVARGGTVLGARVSARVLSAVLARPLLDGPGPFPRLTEREREVLDLVARGYPNARVARHLGVSEKTIRNHVSAVLAKLSRRDTRRGRCPGQGQQPRRAVGGGHAQGQVKLAAGPGQGRRGRARTARRPRRSRSGP